MFLGGVAHGALIFRKTHNPSCREKDRHFLSMPPSPFGTSLAGL